MTPSEHLLVEFVLEKIEGEPMARRIGLLHGLGCMTAGHQISMTFHTMADELEQIEEKHRQLVLDFKRKAAA